MAYGQSLNANSQRAGAFSRFSPEVAKLSNRLGATSSATVNVIVQYKQNPQAAAEARVQSFGGRLSGRLDMIHGRAYNIPVSALAALATDPEVAYVSVDHAVKGLDDYTDSAMNTSTMWNAGYNGSGIGVAVIDSGINDAHYRSLGLDSDELARGLSPGLHGHSTYSWGHQLYDTYGHGTHVAGIIGGNGYKSGDDLPA